MAGGQDLLTEMKDHLVEPESVVNLSISWTDRSVTIRERAADRALVTVAEVADSADVRSHFPRWRRRRAASPRPRFGMSGRWAGTSASAPLLVLSQ